MVDLVVYCIVGWLLALVRVLVLPVVAANVHCVIVGSFGKVGFLSIPWTFDNALLLKQRRLDCTAADDVGNHCEDDQDGLDHDIFIYQINLLIRLTLV